MGVGAGLYMYDVVVKKFTFAILSRDEFLCIYQLIVTYLLLKAISRKQCNIGGYLVLITNRKSHMSFRLVQK